MAKEGQAARRVVKSSNVVKSKSIINPEMKTKILEGQRVGQTNRIKGGHSPKIENVNPKYAVENINVNPDGTKVVKFITQFSDGKLSKIKKSTVFPDTWSDDKIIDSIKLVGDSPSIGTRASDGATLHRVTIDNVQIEVIKVGDEITSGYPTGNLATGLLTGFE